MSRTVHPGRIGRGVAGALVAITVLAVSACGAGDGSASASGGDAAAAARPAAEPASGIAVADKAAASQAQPGKAAQPAVISTGHIALTSSDIVTARRRLDAVLTRLRGHVGDENTQTDEHGVVTRSHLVVRVPSSRFDRAMTDLSEIASLRSASRKSDDVTTQVIDLKARIAAEQAGVQRLRRLVTQTADLRALLDVERALTQRQGQLESLQRERAYLHDRTSEATITVDIARRTTAVPVAHAAGGFVGGLHHGWDAFVAVVTGLLVALGALLPFAAALTVIGVPAWLVVRRARRTRRLRAPAES
jgi:hypothetical protein